MVIGCNMCLERNECYTLFLVLTYAIERKPINVSDARLRILRTQFARYLEIHPHGNLTPEEMVRLLESDMKVITHNTPGHPKE